MIAAILQATVFVRSADGSSVLLMHRNKRADDLHRGKYLSLGVPVADLASRPMWDSDHEWLPMVFDEDARPFFGVMPYAGEEMLGWSFRR